MELANGERIMAEGFVASGLNPQTFLDLLDADRVSPQVWEHAAGFQCNLLAPLFAARRLQGGVMLALGPGIGAPERRLRCEPSW